MQPNLLNKLLLPQVDECVLVTVKSIAEMGAYVTLIEYNNIEGMILLSELSRRRIRSVNKLIRVGKTEVSFFFFLRGKINAATVTKLVKFYNKLSFFILLFE